MIKKTKNDDYLYDIIDKDGRPLKEKNNNPRKPSSMVISILVINIIVFIITMGGNLFTDVLGNFYGYTLYKFQLWRLITCMFVHGSFIHIICNTISFLQIAPFIEAKYGKQNFLFIYFVSGIGASLVSAICNMVLQRPSISIGASGAICGLLGFIFGKMKGNTKNKFISILSIVIPLIIVGISGGNVDNFAHIGGIVTGYLVGRLFNLLKIDGK